LESTELRPIAISNTLAGKTFAASVFQDIKKMENRETEAAPTAAACQLLNGMMVVGQSRRKGIAG